MQPLSERLANALAAQSIVADVDKPLYSFGLHQLGITLLNLTTAVMLGLLFHMLWQSLLFLIAYIPLRQVAGGCHAKTEVRCYLISTLLLCAALWAVHGLPGTFPLIPLFLCASAGIFFLSPVAAENKPLDTTEYAVYRKRARVILAAHWGVALLLLTAEKTEPLSVIVIADTILFGLLVIGKLQRQPKGC